MPLYGDGRNVREWVHVDDHCHAIHTVLTRGRAGEIYNVGGVDELTNLDVTHALLDLCRAPRSMIEQVADRKGHDLRYSLDDTKIRRELGWAPRVSFISGLAATVDWYYKNTAWWRAVHDRASAISG